ncbi:LD-carboxypeptidase [Alteraurantiacibacter aquimixticola]|uniref:LD-carboxypeptidase n=1 Tax=Alteraurantiacibacter aquimixticola TaxID=2489173 RepID=A0A4T3F443_9SPHN|nr:LD-carboxypeptidase [Alteraurantiacibacter aquimixticola]TIX50278.1 LD-carboxypeptidase [Alteraurantiacibacter aquimixticola]
MCPGKPILPERAQAVLDLAARDYPQLELVLHPAATVEHGHFAGDDATRLAAFLDFANDPAFDAIWFGMGGYGSNRIAADALAALGDAAQDKAYLGYSDCGTLLGALYRNGVGKPVHGPLAGDIRRGEEPVRRVLDWFSGNERGLEPGLDHRPAAAFNLMTLAMLVGTEFMPDLTGHVVLVEEVAEHLYAVDRLFFHITQHLHGIAGIRLGEISDVPENDRPFGQSEVEIAEYWCAKSGIPYLGRAEIGHSATNRIVPFGLA